MIRNVMIHVSNEQPLLADLYDVPSAGDSGVLCTNVRMVDGKRPVFIDSIQATFFFPYHIVRFIEIPTGSFDRHRADESGTGGGVIIAPGSWAPEEAGSSTGLTVPSEAAGHPGADDQDVELELDEDFLRRIRDI